MDLKEAAKELIRMGFPVFPCQTKTKKPLSTHGVSDASCDPAVIEAWWTRWPDANIGLACHRCLIIDVDIKENKRGDEDFSILVGALGPLPKAPVARTGGGGWHFFFKRPDQEIVGQKSVAWQGKKTAIDIQVGNQYVIAPPSVHESGNRYEWGNPPVPVEELPELPSKWIDEFLPKKGAKKPVVAQSPVVAWSGDQIVERCRQYVAAIPSAVSGQNGSAQTLCAANAIFGGFALSEEQGWPILMEYNARCQPPWSEKELAHKMRDAIEKPVNPVGWLLESNNTTSYPQVDLSGILEQDDEEDEDDSLPKVEPVPVELLRVPGFIGEVMDFCLKSAPYPMTVTAFCGALALQSFLCARKVRDPGDLRTNLYILSLAGASSGKDQPRKINAHILTELGLPQALGNKFQSGGGLEDSLERQPSMLFQSDEIDGLIRNINRDNDNHTEGILSTLLTLYTNSSTVYPIRVKAGKQYAGFIDQPHLTIFGTATPVCYYQSLSQRLMIDGFFARTIILDAGKRSKGQDAIPLEEMPARIMEIAKWWQAFQPGEHKGNLTNFHPVPVTVPMSESAVREFRDYRAWIDEEYSSAEDRNDEISKTVWGRTNENARKLALIYACSENPKDPVISVEAAKWAMQLCHHQVRRQLFLGREYASRNEFDACLKEAVRVLRAHHAKMGPKALLQVWQLKRRLEVKPRLFDEIVSELQSRRLAVYETVMGRRRPKSGFRLLKPE